MFFLMAKEVMRRRAADNPYFHKDFHGALSTGIEYLDTHFGPQAVREYLRQFARSYYGPLRQALQRRGLAALKDYFLDLYRREGGAVEAEGGEDELVLRSAACPAVAHMRSKGYRVAKLFAETTRTVNETICEGTGFASELVEYDEQTGRSVVRFRRVRP